MCIHPVVNISCVRPYKEPLEGQTSIRPGPVKVTEAREIEYEVDHIVNVQKKGQHMEYLVHWKGYTEEDRTWEPKGNLGYAKAALDLFHERNPRVNLRMMFSGITSSITHTLIAWKSTLREGIVLQTHINFSRFLPIFPDFLERLSHLAPIY
jgi:hypothetical protein